MSFITKKLEEFEEKYQSFEFTDLEVDKEKIKTFISTALNEMIMEVDELIEQHKIFLYKQKDIYTMRMVDVSVITLDKLKQSLSSLREGNK